ncbi:MAG: hypothetical protein R2818_10150 [Flavobacteriales bacterium]
MLQDRQSRLLCNVLQLLRYRFTGMRLITFTLLYGLTGLCVAQNAKPLTAAALDSIYRSDRYNGTLTEWSKLEEKAFRQDCEKQLNDKVPDTKAFCRCAQTVLAANLNLHSTFNGQSQYQQGRCLGHLTQGYCP